MYLNTHSYYSYRYGTMSPEDLLKEACKNEIDVLALTDINSTSGNMNFLRLAPRYAIKPVIGIDFRNKTRQQFIGIAKNNEGYYELNKFLADHLHEKLDIFSVAPKFMNVFVIYPFSGFNRKVLRENEFIGISPQDLNKLKFSHWNSYRHKLVMLQTVSFRNKKDFNAHRLLRAIDQNTLLSKLSKSEEAHDHQMMLPKNELVNIYSEFPELVKNTEQLLDQCNIRFDFGDENINRNLRTYTGLEKNDILLIRKLCEDGLNYRYKNPDQSVYNRVEKELKVIEQKGYVSYFLINWDIINYARQRDYFYVGRGSGANSIVAYLLKITDVDPIELDLYFERFINLYRKNPPDFDIDFSWTDRDDVTRYIFNRFPHTALLATYNTFQYRSVIREIGKVFGLPKREIDILSEGKYQIEKLDHLAKLVLKYSEYIHGFPSHLSIHAGGILISEKPVHYYTTTFMPPKGFPTTQFDMIIAEDIGLYKFDILSQRGLGKIKDALEIVRKNNPGDERIDIHNMQRFKKDEKIKVLLKEGKALGCFYVESPAMRMLMCKLRVDNYLGLVAASSIIRPGVARSGMMKEYILRYRFPERRKSAHPVMMDIMPETFGVMVYQEDVIKVAHYFAGLTLAEADVLRRGMSGKYRSREEFSKVRKKFYANCKAKGYDDKIIREVWEQIESFAGYAFSKGHSASYAVESYQSLFLKAHYPLEYMVAVINNFGGFYRTEHYVHEARMLGGNIHAPCVNKSEKYTVIYHKDIYIGFIHLHELEQQTINNILDERENHGEYKSLEDFLDRVIISEEQLSILIRINAFRFDDMNKRKLLWKAYLKLGEKLNIPKQGKLFKLKSKQFNIPELPFTEEEDAFDQIELLGFSLHHPYLLLNTKPDREFKAKEMKNHVNKEIIIWGYLVTIKYTRTVNKKIMNFGTFLDSEGYFFDTIHFPETVKKYPFRGKGVYKISGKVIEEFEFYSIEVNTMEKAEMIEDPRYSDILIRNTMNHAHTCLHRLKDM